MKKTKLIAKTTVSIFLIQAFLLQTMAWAQAEVISIERADYLAPALNIQADSFKAIVSALNTDSIPFMLPEQAEAIIDILQDDKIELDKKLNIIEQLAQKPIDDLEFLQKLKKIFLKYQAGFLAHALELLLLRDNPAFWFKEEYTRMDEAKFKQLLNRRGIALDKEKERFARFLEQMNQRREKLIAEDEEAWAYPYNCTRFSGIMLMEELKAAGFRADIAVRQYPQNSDRFGIHAYLIVTLGQEEFIIDVSAAQFHKISHDTFEETGIVIVPLADIRQNPEAFEIYTQGQTFRNHFIILSSSAYAGDEQAVLQKIAGKVKFVADTKKVAAEMNIAKVRQEIAANPRLYKSWHAQDKTLKEKLNAFDDQKVLEALGLDEFSAKLAALEMYFKDTYGVNGLGITEEDERLDMGSAQGYAVTVAVKSEPAKKRALELFCKIDDFMSRNPRLLKLVRFLTQTLDIDLNIAQVLYNSGEGETIAATFNYPEDLKKRTINFALSQHNQRIDYDKTDAFLNQEQELTLLGTVFAHETAHLLTLFDSKEFILHINAGRHEKIQEFARRLFGYGLNLNPRNWQGKVYEFADTMWLTKIDNLSQRFPDNALIFTAEQIKTEFLTERCLEDAQELLAEYIALYTLCPGYARENDPAMFEFLELIADWPKIFNGENVDVVLTPDAAGEITNRVLTLMVEQAI